MKTAAQRLIAGSLVLGLCALSSLARADDATPVTTQPAIPKVGVAKTAGVRAPAVKPAGAKAAVAKVADAKTKDAKTKDNKAVFVSKTVPDKKVAAVGSAQAGASANPSAQGPQPTAKASAKHKSPLAKSTDTAASASDVPSNPANGKSKAKLKSSATAGSSAHTPGFAATALPLPPPDTMSLTYDAPLTLPGSMMAAIPQPPVRPNGTVLGDGNAAGQDDDTVDTAEVSTSAAKTLTAPTTFTSAATFSPPTSKGDVNALIIKHAARYAMPETLLRRIVARESGGNPAVRNGPYMGLMQMRLETARGMGYHGTAAGLLDANTNLTYGAAYLANAYKVAGGNLDRAVQLYAGGYYYEAKRKGLLPKLIKSAPSQ